MSSPTETKYTPTFDELGCSRPKFTPTTHRDVYDAIDPSKPDLALKGKTVLITGAGRGIGVGIVESFAKAQAKTIVLIGRSETSLSTVKVDVERKYPDTQFISFSVDLAVQESITNLFVSLKGVVDKIDILISNAGTIGEYGPKIGDTDPEKLWDDMLVNGRGAYLLARGLINFNPPGYSSTFIVFVTTVNEDSPSMAGYMLSKLVPVKMVSLLDVEYPNIRAFAIFPGLVSTDMTLEAFRPMAKDTSALSGGLCVYLSHPRADFLSGRFLSSHWDVDQIQARKNEIIGQNLLKIGINGW